MSIHTEKVDFQYRKSVSSFTKEVDSFPEKVDSFPEKVDSFPKKRDSFSSFFCSRLIVFPGPKFPAEPY